MPLPAKPRLCLIGDSNLAAFKQADQQGLVDFSGYEVEYWGADGPSFRGIWFKNGRIEVSSTSARAVFERVNGQGRTTVAPEDFDELLFIGARVGAADFFGRYLQRKYGNEGWQSQAALDAALRSYMHSSRAYRIGVIFARHYGVKVSLIPSSLVTRGIRDLTFKGGFEWRYPEAHRATAADRAWLWEAFERVALADGVRVIRQPDETVVDGVFTDPKYAIPGADKTLDVSHKSPAFAALLLQSWDPSVSATPAARTA